MAGTGLARGALSLAAAAEERAAAAEERGKLVEAQEAIAEPAERVEIAKTGLDIRVSPEPLIAAPLVAALDRLGALFVALAASLIQHPRAAAAALGCLAKALPGSAATQRHDKAAVALGAKG
jgi:hypothetical protein